MLRRLRPFYIRERFFYACLAIIALFVFSYFFPRLFNIVKLMLLILLVFTILDIIILFSAKRGIRAVRELPDKFSNGDQNPVILSIENFYSLKIVARIIDEIPEQFQLRDFEIKRVLEPASISK
ncbi:MAG: DUF58 domain-containing protein, partial [Bacteroidia bacterium]|nr:DUF58 domain-containing protein [Bacteroidia bacterium]